MARFYEALPIIKWIQCCSLYNFIVSSFSILNVYLKYTFVSMCLCECVWVHMTLHTQRGGNSSGWLYPLPLIPLRQCFPLNLMIPQHPLLNTESSLLPFILYFKEQRCSYSLKLDCYIWIEKDVSNTVTILLFPFQSSHCAFRKLMS